MCTENRAIQDTVVFMTAYSIDDYKKNMFRLRKKYKFQEHLADCHILSFATENVAFTSNTKLKYQVDYNFTNVSSSFKFEVCDSEHKKDDFEDEVKQLGGIVRLTHSLDVLLDKRKFRIPFFVNLESFIVDMASEKYQVDPFAFFLNSHIIICYELINYTTGVPLNKDDIYGRKRNYNIIPADTISYFSDEKEIRANKTISDIIFGNITSFFENTMEVQNYSYVHNILVLSNNIENEKDYFLDVLGVTKMDLCVNNINNNNAYNYYSQEYLGVVNCITDNNFLQALYDCQLLEALKMYILLEQIVTYDNKQTYKETLDSKLNNEILLHLSGVPIITLNAINNIKRTNTYKNYNSSIATKIEFLKLLNERKQNRNSVLLNILLYVLAFAGGIDAIDVLSNKFLLSFNCLFVVFLIVFSLFGVFWWYREKNNK